MKAGVARARKGSRNHRCFCFLTPDDFSPVLKSSRWLKKKKKTQEWLGLFSPSSAHPTSNLFKRRLIVKCHFDANHQSNYTHRTRLRPVNKNPSSFTAILALLTLSSFSNSNTFPDAPVRISPAWRDADGWCFSCWFQKQAAQTASTWSNKAARRGIGVACVPPGHTDDWETPEDLLQVLQTTIGSFKKKKKNSPQCLDRSRINP